MLGSRFELRAARVSVFGFMGWEILSAKKCWIFYFEVAELTGTMWCLKSGVWARVRKRNDLENMRDSHTENVQVARPVFVF